MQYEKIDGPRARFAAMEVPESLYQAAQRRAGRDGCSLNYLRRQAVAWYLAFLDEHPTLAAGQGGPDAPATKGELARVARETFDHVEATLRAHGIEPIERPKNA